MLVRDEFNTISKEMSFLFSALGLQNVVATADFLYWKYSPVAPSLPLVSKYDWSDETDVRNRDRKWNLSLSDQ